MNTSELEGMPKGTLRLRYSTNHDQASEASPIECYGGERGAMSAFVLTTMLEGIPLIYSSQEVAYPRSLNFFNYGVIDLKSNEVFAQEMAEIIRAYKATSSVRGGELEVYTTGDAASFYRAAGSHGMLVMVNTANESVQVKVPMEHAGKTMTDVILRCGCGVAYSNDDGTLSIFYISTITDVYETCIINSCISGNCLCGDGTRIVISQWESETQCCA